jgi:hypothetical protein
MCKQAKEAGVRVVEVNGQTGYIGGKQEILP